MSQQHRPHLRQPDTRIPETGNAMTRFMPPNPLKAVLFDKDGTLIDFERTWAPVNRAVARLAASGDTALEARLLTACGVDPSTGRTRADSLFASGNAAEIAGAMLAHGSPWAHAELTAELDAIFAGAGAGAVGITDLAALFARLRRAGLAIGIASSDAAVGIRQTIRALGIEGQVDFVAGYDSGHGHKPDAGMALAFCHEVGCRPAEMVLVGDNRHDLAMGRAARAGAVIGVLSGTGTAETLGDLADVLIASVADLPETLGI
jgi:phosphoglycolate phosphatase